MNTALGIDVDAVLLGVGGAGENDVGVGGALITLVTDVYDDAVLGDLDFELERVKWNFFKTYVIWTNDTLVSAHEENDLWLGLLD